MKDRIFVKSYEEDGENVCVILLADGIEEFMVNECTILGVGRSERSEADAKQIALREAQKSVRILGEELKNRLT